MGKDTIWLRGERAPRKDVTITTEGAIDFTFEEGGKQQKVEGWRVRAVRHEGSPPELGAAIGRIAQGDFATAEKALDALASNEKGPEWLRTHASFHRANARRLRAQLEGHGHDEAIALFQAWLGEHEDHWLTPAAFLASGELLLDQGEAAHPLFALLTGKPFGEPWKLLGRWGEACRTLHQGWADQALAKFEKLETEALAAEWGHEAAQLARIGRAQALHQLGKTREGAALLGEVVDLEPWQGTPARVRALNVLADLCVELGGKTPDGGPTQAGILAALPFWTKVVRYSTDLPLERARALAGAHVASVAAGLTHRAAHLKKELVTRFPTAKWTKEL